MRSTGGDLGRPRQVSTASPESARRSVESYGARLAGGRSPTASHRLAVLLRRRAGRRRPRSRRVTIPMKRITSPVGRDPESRSPGRPSTATPSCRYRRGRRPRAAPDRPRGRPRLPIARPRACPTTTRTLAAAPDGPVDPRADQGQLPMHEAGFEWPGGGTGSGCRRRPAHPGSGTSATPETYSLRAKVYMRPAITMEMTMARPSLRTPRRRCSASRTAPTRNAMVGSS